MDGKTFNRAAAKAAGYSDAEIEAFLASRQSPRTDTAPRRPAGVPEMAPRESTMAPRRQSLAERGQEQGRREQVREQNAAMLQAVPAFLANVSRDIPGAEAAQAGVRAVVRGQPYREALADIRQATDALPTVARVAPRVAGAALAGAVMPGGTALRQGAAFGALSGLTEASPDIGVGSRVGRALGQAAVGGAAAKGAQVAGTVLRSAFTPSRATQLIGQSEATARRSGPRYEEFRKLGELPETDALNDILNLRVVRTAIDEVKGQSPTLSKLPDTDARVLDAVYKRVGNKAFTAKHGFETGEARAALLDAIDEASGGLYRPAVGMFRTGAQQSAAIQRGARAAQVASTGGGTTMRAALEESPEALAKWAETATAAQRRAAVQGVLSGLGSRAASDISRINVFQPFSWLPAARRANIASNLIADIERSLPRTPVRRTAEAFLPTFLTPRDRSTPTAP